MVPTGPVDRFDAFRALAERRGRPGERLVGSLAEARARTADGPGVRAPAVTAGMGLLAAAALGPAGHYADLTAPHGRRQVRVCEATACFAAQLGRHLCGVERELGVAAGAATPDGETSLQAVRCLGHCYAGPAALDGDATRTGPTPAAQLAGRAVARDAAIPAADDTGDPVLLGRLPAGEPARQVWPRIVTSGTPGRVGPEVAASGLRGRGGAGCRVATKWAAVGRAPGTVVADGDEGDPGSFADRLLREAAPERVPEGLVLACFACGARQAVALVRSEYPRALARMREAVARAYADGHFGRSVHGTGTAVQVFATPDGRAHLAAAPYLPPGEPPDDDYLLLLVTGRRWAHHNSGSTTRHSGTSALDPVDLLDLHPDDAARYDLREGARVGVDGRHGRARLTARVSEQAPPGQAFCSFRFTASRVNRATSEHANTATSCPEYQVMAVRVHDASTGGAR
ncbi:molybdopterin dinucleotide binding domain-containing protein [Streptomyces camelliae]|uniref:NAD(P)H-dependent oxidoreductase subunit E n=1 Tax=Streptomyces camelliae TaxID=3004093 RepID=A0ABY7PH28_9ACTN|nr:molybdopterin dinucleotide binding domain-containing protein [Streptomyces sp. HUAS 2-6]WBO68653.1 NAD(P)H-dependent oxidoreductase subunit E [Streptomyces sp. HUAS 2-6]